MPTLVILTDSDQPDRVADLFEDCGGAVIVAPDTVKGRASIRDVQPDLIVLERTLPAFGDWSTIQKLRNAKTSRSTVIVALVDFDSASDRGAALAAGCSSYFPRERVRMLRDRVRQFFRSDARPKPSRSSYGRRGRACDS